MEPSWRKPVGVLALLVYLIVYAVIVSSFGATLDTLPTILKVVAYLAAGLAWVLPLKPLFVWMNTGRWSSK
ncbi:DUF2842 domain-containing protein [Sandarakinorhabdus sp. DWP1-3-1]|uniref:DUF2842 domain-containing protein n=1 Tax=Sandarakinorhabdus sp. DWP1-3-1 TaxID=2804627 RepID=UPI003CF1935D